MALRSAFQHAAAAALLGAALLASVGPVAAAGNPAGHCPIPTEARAEDSASPDVVVGDGTPASCTGAAVVAAVAQGGVIRFDCGPQPVTITLTETAKIFNNTGPRIVIDGGGKVTLSGGGQVRILYMNTCDQAQVWTTSHCQNQDHPQLTVQNLTFADGNASGESPDGGGAIFVRGGRFKVVNSSFVRNVCDDAGPDVGGAAIRVLSQYQGLPVYVTQSTFGGAPDLGNVCSNGGGLSSIGVSYTVLNSLFSHNRAIGSGANPQQPGTPGGGSGGGIYNDGNTFTLRLCGTRMQDNSANEGGGAIFFVSNDASGDLVIEDSVLGANPSLGFETRGLPGIFLLGDATPEISDSLITAPEPAAALVGAASLGSLLALGRRKRDRSRRCEGSGTGVPNTSPSSEVSHTPSGRVKQIDAPEPALARSIAPLVSPAGGASARGSGGSSCAGSRRSRSVLRGGQRRYRCGTN